MSGTSPGESFADLIADARKAKRWSQEDLERVTGVSRSTLSRWERGQADRPEPEHVRAVCHALGIDPRRAAVALGYLSAEEAGFTPATTDPDVEEILSLLPHVSDEERRQWIQYLRFLVQQSDQDKRGRNAS